MNHNNYTSMPVLAPSLCRVSKSSMDAFLSNMSMKLFSLIVFSITPLIEHKQFEWNFDEFFSPIETIILKLKRRQQK